MKALRLILLIFITFPSLAMNWWTEPKEARTKARQEQAQQKEQHSITQALKELAQNLKQEALQNKLSKEIWPQYLDLNTVNIPKIQELINSGLNPNEHIKFNARAGVIQTNLIGLAAFLNSNELVDQLLSKGASPNPTYNGDPYSNTTTALAQAVIHNNTGMIKRLLANNANPYALVLPVSAYLETSVEHRPNTILNLAIKQTNPEALELLLQSGANPNYTPEPYLPTPLMAAANTHPFSEWNFHRNIGSTTAPHVIPMLIKYGANPSLVNSQGQTALIIAAQNSGPEILQALIDTTRENVQGIEQIAKSTDSYANLLLADVRKLTSTLRLNEYINHADANGNTALIETVKRNNHKNIHILLNNGANILLKNKQGKSALDIAQNEAFQGYVNFPDTKAQILNTPFENLDHKAKTFRILFEALAKQQSQGTP